MCFSTHKVFDEDIVRAILLGSVELDQRLVFKTVKLMKNTWEIQLMLKTRE
jgi:hypothetical protein